MRTKFLRTIAAVVVVACFPLLGCGVNSAEESLASAKTYLARNDFPAAIIELKNALQAKPDLAEARFLIGQALLDNEQAIEAVVELRKAAELNYPADQVTPLLAKAYLQSGEAGKAIQLEAASSLTAPEAIAGLKTQVAFAYAALGSPEKSEAALDQALRVNATYAPALLMRARMLAAKRDLDGALRVTDEVLARTPADLAALMLKADMLRVKNDEAGAAEQYHKVLAIMPNHVSAHVGLLTQALAKSDVAGARSQLDALKKERPKHPKTLLYEATLAALAGDTKFATELVQQLLKYDLENPQTLYLAAGLALKRDELALAEKYLNKLVQLAPSMASARNLLARAHLRAGHPAKALDALLPLLEAESPNPDSLALAGTAYLQSGDARRAEEAFGRAAMQKPNDANNRTALALARIARGDSATGLSELETVAGAETGTNADMALISTQLKQGNYDAALKAIDRLQAKQPGRALPLQLRGMALALKGDITGARANYDKALAAEPGFFPAADGLAALDLRDKKPGESRARFEALLKANPNDERAMVALAALDDRAGKPKQEVAATLEKAIALKPSDPTLRRRLIQYHVGKQDYKLALAAAQNAVGALPNDADMLALLAGAQLASGDVNQAISSYNKLVAAQPKAPGPLLALAEAQLVAKSYDDAADTVKKAMTLAPESAVAVRQAVKVDSLVGKYDAALAKARAYQARNPKAPEGWIIEGDVELARRNWPDAVMAYRSALRKEDSAPTAERLHSALRKAGDKAKAEAFAVEWLNRHPQDPAFLFYLSSLAIADKNYELAATQLEEVLRNRPDSPVVLNNLAWVQATLKKPGAVANAERVNQLAPNQPAYMDTLAYALAAEGKIARAVEVQKKALELAPSANGLRLNMARLYVQAGDKAAASTELDTLAKLGDKFAQQNDVRELQSKL